MDKPTLYRKRLIPDQLIRLDDDILIYQDDEVIITKWHTINPKPNLTHGISCYFLKKGIKVSKFYDHARFKFYYIDIIDVVRKEEENSYTFVDLLIDVIIRPDGFVKVVDLDELCDAVTRDIITQAELQDALRTTDRLLRSIYKHEFAETITKLEELDDCASNIPIL